MSHIPSSGSLSMKNNPLYFSCVYIYTNIDPKWDTATGHMYTIVKITKVLIKAFYEIIPTIMMKSQRPSHEKEKIE